MTKKVKIIVTVLLSIILLVGIGFICVNQFLSKANYTDWSNTTHIPEQDVIDEMLKEEQENQENDDINQDIQDDNNCENNENNEEVKDNDKNENKDDNKLEEVNPDDVIITPTDPLESIPNISNILLIGEENWYNDKRGRTDSMMILTIDKENESLKLTSIMRDSYVTIPGYQDNRINAAYAIGGVPLLIDTIQTNFGITIDNTALVNFEAFKDIINILGGVDIEISQIEADYLNKNNYIGEEEYRNLKAGLNHFNGSQALAYSRIRKVKGMGGEHSDFGRTDRQRKVLSALYDEYKSASLRTLLDLANEIIPYVTTDMSKTEIIEYITAVVFMMPDEIETFRVPVNKSYKSVSIRNMSVLQIDFDMNRKALKEFIYGIETEDTMTIE